MKKLLLIVLMFVAVSVNGQWRQMNAPNSSYITSFAVSGTNIFAGVWSYGGMLISSDNGLNWDSINNGLTGLSIYKVAVSGTNIYAGTFGHGLSKSTNNGVNWFSISNELITETVMSLLLTGNRIYAGTWRGIFVSTNNGANWSVKNNGLTNLFIYSLAIYGTNIFAGSLGGGIFLSTNNGANWVEVNDGLNSKEIYAFQNIGPNIFVATNGGVYLSTNNGTNWTTRNNGLPDVSVYSLALSGTNLFAGTSQGVYMSTNNGQNWLNKNQGFYTSQIVYDVIIFNEYIFAGTEYNSVWRRPLSEIIGVQNISTEIPSSYSLNQNYPNPFNPSTVVRFSLSVVSNVVLKVYDVKGREIETLVNEQLQPGTYSTQWNASAYSSGVYFYKIQAGEFTETKRMLMIK